MPSIQTAPMGDESGFILLTSMMIMIAVAMLGLAATTTSIFEMQIAGNGKWYQQQFYHADSGINNLLAQDLKPVNGNLLPAAPVPTCSSLPAGAVPFSSIDPAGIGVNNVNLYYLQRINPVPFVAEIMSCATRGNVIVEVIAGVQYGIPPGGTGGSGDQLEYN